MSSYVTNGQSKCKHLGALACAEAYRQPPPLKCYGKRDYYCKESKGCKCELTRTCEKDKWRPKKGTMIKIKKCTQLKTSKHQNCRTQWGEVCNGKFL